MTQIVRQDGNLNRGRLRVDYVLVNPHRHDERVHLAQLLLTWVLKIRINLRTKAWNQSYKS